MIERLADELRVIFTFLTVADLLSARGCARALRATLDPRRARARRVWQAAHPIEDFAFDSIPTAPGAQLWQIVFPGRGNPNQAFIVACQRGWLAKAQWLDATCALVVRWPSGDGECASFVDACAHGHLAVAQWLAARHAIAAREAGVPMRRACEAGHLDVAQWLAAAFGLTVKDVRAANDWILRYTCGNGHLPVVQWLVAHFGIESAAVSSGTITAMLRAALNAGHAATADWLVRQFNNDIAYGFQAYTPQERRFIARFYELDAQAGAHTC